MNMPKNYVRNIVYKSAVTNIMMLQTLKVISNKVDTVRVCVK